MKYRNLFMTVLTAFFTLAVVTTFTACGGDEEDDFTSKTTDIPNDVTTLGIVGTTVRSTNEKVAVAAIENGKITVTSKGAGSATIVVEEGPDISDAEISVTVSADGGITIDEKISKGGVAVVRIGGSIDVSVAGKNPKVVVAIRIQGVSGHPSVDVDEDGKWMWKTAAFTKTEELFFVLSLTFEDGSGWEYWDWGGNDAHVHTQASKTDIELPALSVKNFVTLSGAVSASIDGNWDAADKSLSIGVDGLSASGGTGALSSLNDGNWSITMPAPEEERTVTFSVRYGASNPWSRGQKRNLAPTVVHTADVSGIDLGDQKFVILSGTTPVTVNGNSVFIADLDFGKYGDGQNGWSGGLGIGTDGKWAVPMPENIDLDVIILYKIANNAEQAKTTPSVSINTGAAAHTVDLSAISTITIP